MLAWPLLLAALAAPGCGRDAARSLVALGDSYTVLTARFLLPIAEGVGCPAERLDLARNGWTAREMLAQRAQWLPALREAPAPVLVVTTVGYNDLLAPRSARTPAEAADDARWLFELLEAEVGASGGELLHLAYADVWALPPHPVHFDGRERALDPRPSALLEAFYRRLHAGGADTLAHYRFVDVRGWGAA